MNENSFADETKIFETIYKAFDQVNETLPKDKHIEKSPETVLLGEEGAIDSLGLTMLIVAIEQKIEEEFGVVITLVDASTMSKEHSPFRNVNKLAGHITMLLKEKADG
jgi:acyl carrier protein